MTADRARELDESLQARARCAGQPGIQMRGRNRRVLESVKQSEFLLEQKARNIGLLACWTSPRSASCPIDCLSGAFQQRPAGVLDLAALGGARALVGVPLVAAHLVDGALGEADDVEWAKALSRKGYVDLGGIFLLSGDF